MDEGDKVVENVEHVGTLKEKLLAVSNEIDVIKNSFSRSAEDLSRIQSLINVEHLDEIDGIFAAPSLETTNDINAYCGYYCS